MIAWQTGVDLARADGNLIRFLLQPERAFREQLSGEAWTAREALGHDTWAWWVRCGHIDAVKARQR
jgi:hypothetical protein